MANQCPARETGLRPGGVRLINYLVTRTNEDSVVPFVEMWQSHLVEHVVITFYEDLPDLEVFECGAVVFSDLERLSVGQMDLARGLCDHLLESHPRPVILNNPSETKLRFDLLQALYLEGVNPFRAQRVSESMTSDRFPVFLRYENYHSGALTDLIDDQDGLDRAIAGAYARGRALDRILIVEFCDTSNGSGRFTKYGAFVVGDRILARHEKTNANWVVKGDDYQGQDVLERELEYIEANPHAGQISRVVEVGRFGYGRLDYSMLGDRLVAWEFNTNPLIVRSPDEEPEFYREKQERFLPMLADALLAAGEAAGEPVEVSLAGVPAELRDRGRISGPPGGPVRSVVRKAKPVVDPVLALVEMAARPFAQPLLTRARRSLGQS